MTVFGYRSLREGRYSSAGQIYHVVSRTWQRRRMFSDWNYARVVCRSFTSQETLRDSLLLCWVLMPDHVHWLVQLGEADGLAGLTGRMKSLSAREVRIYTGHQGSVWYPGYYERAIRKEDDLLAVARYIVANPLRAGLCKSVRQYPYWNAVYL